MSLTSFKSLKPISLPEPPGPPSETAEIFETGIVRRAVLIGNGSPAAENQSIGLVRALGLSDRHVLYRVNRPTGGVNEWLHWLPVFIHKKIDFMLRLLRGYSQLLLTSQGKMLTSLSHQNVGNSGLSVVLEADVKHIVNFAHDTYEKEGPLLIVASGRDTISVASSIKRFAAENVFVVQILHPRSHLNRFDLVITPHHDYYHLTPQAQEQFPRFLRRWIRPRDRPDNNVVLTVGALHQFDFAALRGAAKEWHDVLGPLAKPLLVVNIGRPTCHCRYGLDLAKQLAASLLRVLVSCGSIRISFSNRTPQKVVDLICKELGSSPKVYIWNGKGPNPHIGHLAWADSFVITADSISMISEACSTGKPVYIIGAERCRWKFSEFHKSLTERGVVRPFTGSEDMSESWSYPPLNDTAEAARRVQEALAKRGWRLKT